MKTLDASRSLLERLFRLSLWLYPRDLRQAYGGDMTRFLHQLEARARDRRLGRLRLAGRLLLDAVTAIPRAHRWQAQHVMTSVPTPGATPWRRFGKESHSMTTFPHDLRVAFRRARQNPGFTLVAAFTLALGIGANTAIFSVVYGVLLRPIGVADPEQLAVLSLHRTQDPGDAQGMWPSHLVTMREEVEGRAGVQQLASYLFDSVTLLSDGEPQELGTSLMVDGAFFDTLGVDPLLGRALEASDLIADRRGNACVISETLWRSRFGSDPDIVGRVLSIDGAPVEVVGVMPDNVPLPQTGVQLWQVQGWDVTDNRLFGRLGVLARLEPDAAFSVAEQALAASVTRFAETNPRFEAYTISLSRFRQALIGSAQPAILAAAGAVGLILLIACANMASLLLSRAVVREREIATRRALGAQRRQLTTQLLSESLLLSGLGGVLGVGLAFFLHRVLLDLASGLLPRLYDVRLDLPVLGFAVGISLLAGLVFGLAPAIWAFTRDLAGAMRGRRHARSRQSPMSDPRQALVVMQVAVAVVLVTAAALLLRNLAELRAVEPGFEITGLGGARVYLDDDAYSSDAQEIDYYLALLERLRATPGIVAAGASSGLPLDPLTIDYDLPYALPGEPESETLRQAHFRTITPGYLETLGVPLLRGRVLAASDRSDTEKVAVINETFARVAWGESNPVGESFSIYGGSRTLQVVGVVGDVRFHGPAEQTRPAFFVPHTQTSYGSMTVIARSASSGHSGDSGDHDARSAAGRQVSAAVARAALATDRNQPVHSTFALADLERGAVATDRFYGHLIAAFAAVALLLAGAGIYGVVAYWVNESRRELGLRMAVGATGGDIVGLVVSRSLKTSLIGLALGMGFSGLAARGLEPFLFGVTATDSSALTAVVAVSLAAAIFASLVPAITAARIDPVRSLRGES
ncbi:MAG: ADOP family duplicated permease [Acidobacteriota bacterium]